MNEYVTKAGLVLALATGGCATMGQDVQTAVSTTTSGYSKRAEPKEDFAGGYYDVIEKGKLVELDPETSGAKVLEGLLKDKLAEKTRLAEKKQRRKVLNAAYFQCYQAGNCK